MMDKPALVSATSGGALHTASREVRSAWWSAAAASSEARTRFALQLAERDGRESERAFARIAAQIAMWDARLVVELPALGGLLGDLVKGIHLGRVGRLQECIERLETVAGTARLELEEVVLAHALEELGRARGMSGDDRASGSALKEATELARRLDLPVIESISVGGVGMLFALAGRHTQYIAYTERALAIAEAAGDVYGTAHCRSNLAGGLTMAKRFDEAIANYESVLEIGLQHGFERLRALALAGLGNLELGRGQLEVGHERLLQARALLEVLGDPYQSCWNDLMAAKSLRDLGELDVGRQYLDACRSLARTAKLTSLQIRECELRSSFLELQGDLRGALSEARESLALERSQFDTRLEEATRTSRRAERALGALRQAEIERRRRRELENSEQALREALAKEAELRRVIQQTARTDALTGVANRRAHEEDLPRVIADAGRINRPVGILLIDVDHFKSVNDRFGHGVGDEVLVGIAMVMKGAIRHSDWFARWGGEEFTVAAPGVDERSIEGICESIRQAVSLASIPTSSGSVSVTVSIGGAVHPPGAVDIDSTVRLADVALYRAKRSGRNRSCIATRGSTDAPPEGL